MYFNFNYHFVNLNQKINAHGIYQRYRGNFADKSVKESKINIHRIFLNDDIEFSLKTKINFNYQRMKAETGIK